MFEVGVKAKASCQADGTTVRILTKGELIPVEPKAREGERIAIDDLLAIAKKMDTPEAFRPKWLDFTTATRIRPRNFAR